MPKRKPREFTVKLDGLHLRTRPLASHHRPLSPEARAVERAMPEWRLKNGERRDW